MPIDSEKLRKSYIKKARNILILTPGKQEKAKKKLKKSLEKREQHVQDFETSLSLYRNKDEKGLKKHTEALRKRARLEGKNEKISDVRVPITRSEYLKHKAKYDAIPWVDRPPVLPKGKTVKQWWAEEMAGLKKKLESTKADRDALFEDNKTLLELEIDNLESQKAIIEPLKFENMEKHFGGRFYYRLADKEVKEINKKTKDERKRKELYSAELTNKNKARFTEIRDNELYRIDYSLKKLHADYKKLTGKKYKGG